VPGWARSAAVTAAFWARVGQLLRARPRAELLDLHRDGSGKGLVGRGPAQRRVQSEREDYRGGPERDRREGHHSAGGPGERRREA